MQARIVSPEACNLRLFRSLRVVLENRADFMLTKSDRDGISVDDGVEEAQKFIFGISRASTYDRKRFR
jgi:hypothetical protein